jgi:hypothetical protein
MRVTFPNGWIVAFLVWGGVLLYRAPYYASNLETVPDSVEYVAMGWRAAREGRITLPIEGRELPSRYQPWFSLALLAPIYGFKWADPGHGIWSIFLLALVGMAFCWRMAAVGGGMRAAFAAAILLLAGTDYAIWGRKILTDVPATACVLVLAYLFITSAEVASRHLGRTLFEGLLLLFITLWRPAFVLFSLPFLYAAWRGRAWRHLSVYAVLLAVAAIVLLGYNTFVFGHPLRSGYVFWCSQVYGLDRSTFALGHIWPNVRMLMVKRVAWVWWQAFLGFLFPKIRCAWRERTELRAFLLFLIVAGLPFAGLHLLYFFHDTRLFLPMSALLAGVAGIHIGLLAERMPERWLRWGLAGLLLLTVAWRLAWYRPLPPPRRVATDTVAASTPSQAIIVSAIDPVYWQLMLGCDTERRFVPISRDVEYASKEVYASWLRRESAEKLEPAVKYVANEQVLDLQARVRRGEEVFVAMHLADEYGVAQQFQGLMQHFEAVEVAPRLWKLVRVGDRNLGAP